MYYESEKTELKKKFNDSICKEMVSFLNTEGGQIIIGVDDNGNPVGVLHIDETMRKISDVISTQILPNSQDLITASLQVLDSITLIVVEVRKGLKPLYCQKKYGYSPTGCSIRVGTTCREMTEEQISLRYEQNFLTTDLMIKTPAKFGSISFKTLKIYYSERGFHIDENNIEANLNLKTEKGTFNLLAELMSDINNVPIIFVKFKGNDKTFVSEQNDYGSQCLLFAYERLKNRIKAENIQISDTSVRPRIDKYLFDYESANEAIINAFVHNDWNISQPLFTFFDNRFEILSHGGLPKNETKEMFFKGISKPRNDSLMRIFLNMHLVEHTGHGIPLIVAKYGQSVFEIDQNFLKVIIPFEESVLNYDKKVGIASLNENIFDGLNKSEISILIILIKDPTSNAKEIAKILVLSQRTIERIFIKLQKMDLLRRIGQKKNGYWKINK